MTNDGDEDEDRLARAYETWWAPVLAPAAHRLLDLVADGAGAAAARRLVDVGTGTGTLALAAAARWPHLDVLGVDASAAMLSGARRKAARLDGPIASRLRLVEGFADRLPVEQASVDVVVSSFVLQLVPSRLRALRAAHEALRPGGQIAYVTWLADDRGWAPDDALNEALEAAGVSPTATDDDDDPPDAEEVGSGGLRSVGAAADQTRRAGFVDVRARRDVLRHPFTPASCVGFFAGFDEEDLFRSLDGATRERLEAELLRRLEAVPPALLHLDAPVVYVTGRRPHVPTG